MDTLKFIVVVSVALVFYSLALRRMHMGSELLPHSGGGRDHIHDSYHQSYIHSALHMLHLENDDVVESHEVMQQQQPSVGDLMDAIQAVDAAVLSSGGGVQEASGVDSGELPTLTSAPEPSAHGVEDVSEHQGAQELKDGELGAGLEAVVLNNSVPHVGTAEELQPRSPPLPEPTFRAFVPKVAPDAGWMNGGSRLQPNARQSSDHSSASSPPVPKPATAVEPSRQAKLKAPSTVNAVSPPPFAAPAPRSHAPPPQQSKSPRQNGLPCGQFGAWRHGRCVCNRLRTGQHCERHVDLAGFKVLRKVQEDFKGAITMSKQGLAGKRVLRVFLPGKESEPDKGNRVLGRVTSGLLDAVEERDIFYGKIYDRCAVVGSSGILHHFEFGKEIDQHDMVLRFNSAPTRGFERLVGSKTTHRITNTQNWIFRESDSEHILVHMRSTSSLTAVIRTHVGDRKVKLAPFDTDFVHYMANSLPFMATSGLYGIIIALHRCAEVDLYGFQVSNQHGAKYHYYNVCDQPANAERDGAEWYVVKAIVQSGLARFREPCIIECHESKVECERCKTSTQLKKVTNYGKAERTQCPRCSTQYGGCRPPQHWAFRRRFVPPKGHN